jgi:hypothetical protein
MPHDERTSLEVQQKTRNLEAAEHLCFAMIGALPGFGWVTQGLGYILQGWQPIS